MSMATKMAGSVEAVDTMLLSMLAFIFVKIYYACAGYLNFAEMSMVTKLAGSVEAVNTMLLSLLAFMF
jgi:hypothetical protein